MGIIENIVDRCHVSDTPQEVLDIVISKLENGQETFDAMTKNQRGSFKLAVLRAHAANRDLYFKVTSGRF